MKPVVLVLSCEHAVNTIPTAYQHLFSHQHTVLDSPQAYDVGAFEVAKHIQTQLVCDLIPSSVSRLLVDCDHSWLHARCFSKFSKKLSLEDKKQLLQQYYTPFYQQLDQMIDKLIHEKRQVLHLSVHTFAPKFRGMLHQTGIGLLYASNRHAEKEVARIIHGLLLQESVIPYKIRLNYPFSGSKDYVLNHYRKQYEQQDYLGIKLDINQALLKNTEDLKNLALDLSKSLQELLVLL